MFVKVLRWRLPNNVQTDDAFTDFVIRLSHRNLQALRPLGLVEGYIVRVGPAEMLTINFYYSEANMIEAFEQVTGTAEYAADFKIELLDHMEGPAFDLPMSLTLDDLSHHIRPQDQV